MAQTIEEKTTTERIDDLNDPVKPQGDVVPDYSGAAAKTDPKEIALVRKLDWWIMVGTIQETILTAPADKTQPMLWSMYWL